MGFLEDDRSFADVPTIPEYYDGKTIFITGGSGFMGKVLIEKLLYSCEGLARIYLLLRCKKGVRSEDRLTELYSSQCFDRLRKEKPDIFASKVFVIPGDVMEAKLGISEDERAFLINNVNIIFHSAASVRFNDPLPFAVKMNLNGTKELIELAKDAKHLSALIHVSTAYSNTNRNPVEEVMYPPHADWREVLQICEEADEDTIRTLTPKMLGEIPNTYAFTKQLAEHLVYESRGHLPVAICRPSIVISSVKEPMEGWIENFNGPVGMLVASGKGIMRSVYVDAEMKADYMPVDICIKAIIAAAWARGTKELKPTDDIPIFNCCAGDLNYMTTAEIIEQGREIAAQLPLNDMLWNIGGSATSSKTVHYVKVLLLHLLPALLVDMVLWIIGRKPMLIKLQRRIYIANLALDYYITKEWTFANKNFISLRSAIKDQDKDTFYYDVENIDPKEYFTNACLGAKRYLLKEKDEDLPRARTHLKRMQVLDFVVQSTFYGFILWWFIKLSFVRDLINMVLSVMQI